MQLYSVVRLYFSPLKHGFLVKGWMFVLAISGFSLSFFFFIFRYWDCQTVEILAMFLVLVENAQMSEFVFVDLHLMGYGELILLSTNFSRSADLSIFYYSRHQTMVKFEK